MELIQNTQAEVKPRASPCHAVELANAFIAVEALAGRSTPCHPGQLLLVTPADHYLSPPRPPRPPPPRPPGRPLLAPPPAPSLSPRPTSRGPACRGPCGLGRQCWVPDQVRDDNWKAGREGRRRGGPEKPLPPPRGGAGGGPVPRFRASASGGANAAIGYDSLQNRACPINARYPVSLQGADMAASRDSGRGNKGGTDAGGRTILGAP